MYGVDSLPYLAILTGIICLIVFLLKWERYVLLVPSSVMEGFTVGVAFIIALNQVRTIFSLSGVCVRARAPRTIAQFTTAQSADMLLLYVTQINFALGLGQIPRHEEFVYNVMESFRYATDTGTRTHSSLTDRPAPSYTLLCAAWSDHVAVASIARSPRSVVVRPVPFVGDEPVQSDDDLSQNPVGHHPLHARHRPRLHVLSRRTNSISPPPPILPFPSFSFVLSHTLDFATQYIPFRLQTLQTRYGDVRSPNPRHALEWDGVRVESNAPRFGW